MPVDEISMEKAEEDENKSLNKLLQIFVNIDCIIDKVIK